jgi:nucleoside-diphosphate-sugar epimerase
MNGFVVVTGASGFIGSEVCARFRRNRRPTLGIARSAPSHPGADVQVVGDLYRAPEAMLDDALHGASAVVHLAGRAHVMRETDTDPERAYREANVEMTARLARAAIRVGVRRFVLASSVKVMGEETRPGHPFTADDIPQPSDPYARSKLAAEQALFSEARGSPMLAVALRLPLVYGRDAGGNFARLVDWVRQRRPLPFGAIRNRRSILYVGNLATALEAVLDAPALAPGAYFLADALAVSTPELVRAIAHAWQQRVALTRVPVWALEGGALVVGRHESVRRLTRSLEVDTSVFCRATGWEPRYTLRRALAQIAAQADGRSARTTAERSRS